MSAEPVTLDATEQLSPALRDWMTLERFHLHKPDFFQNLERDPAFDIRYLPQHSRPFQLPCYWVPRRRLYLLGAPPAATMSFLSETASDERVLFPIHPSALDDFRPWLRAVDARDASVDGLWIWAVPTSSTRTLLAWPDGAGERAVFVKTSLHTPIFRNRRVTRIRVGLAMGLNSLAAAERGQLPGEVHILPEVFGFSPRRALDSGAVVRLVPPEVINGRSRVAPLFSLLGGQQGRVPLLLSMLDRVDVAPVEFIDRLLCAWFAPLWAELALRHGFILESHAQDLMLGLSPDGVATGDLYYRDLEGLQIDWEWRRHLRLATPELPNGWAWRETFGTWGYRYFDFIWWKWRISLFGFMRMVLAQVEEALRDWHKRGLVRGPQCAEGELTTLFSHHLFTAVERLFNVSLGPRYDTLPSLNRFVRTLIELRKLAIHSGR